MFATVKETLKHSSAFGFANILQKGVGFLMIPVYTHYLTPKDYGILEILDLSIMVLGMVTAMGIGGAVVRFYHGYDDPENRQEVFSTALLTTFFACCLVTAILESMPTRIAGFLLNEPKYSLYFQIIFISMAFQTIAAIPESLLLAQKRSRLYSLITIGTFVSYITLNILFIVVLRMGVLGMLLSMIITKGLNTSALLVLCRQYVKIMFSFSKLRRMLEYSVPLVPASFAMYCIHYADRFFVQKYCGSSELGIYSLGYKFGMIVSVLLADPIFKIWNTQGLEIAKRDDAPLVFSRMFTYIVFVMLFGGLAISTVIDEVVVIMAPDTYQGAASVVALIVLSYVLSSVATYFSMGMAITYRTRSIPGIQGIGAVLNVCFNATMIPRYGIMGAAIATCLTFSFLAIATWAVSQRLYRVRLEIVRVAKLIGLTLIYYAVSRIIVAPLATSLMLKGFLLLSFPLMLYISRFFEPQESEKVLELIRTFWIRLNVIRRFSH